MNTPRTLIGIPVRDDPAATAQTLASLRECRDDVAVVLLGDGVDEGTRSALDRLGATRLLAWERTLGNAACFNRLVQSDDADLYVLLENGARVAPRWLERIGRALAADPSHGIAGPSTNRAWNEQLAFPDLRPDAAGLDQAALEAAARFGAAHAELRPLHSLGDFCYAVTPALVQAIGAADEGYGNGPCWEMDYNIRAARAGFAGLWVKAAIVWRPDPSTARQTAEARRFLINKRRYQDHFCGLHLGSTSRSYDTHCTGEACPHFAPPGLVTIRREFPATTALPAAARVAQPETRIPRRDAPRVTCIMPTADRRAYVGQAIAAFLAQDYAHRELVIVDDGIDSIEDLVPNDARIHYVRRPRGQSLGAKRNEACRLAQGEIIVHWDDDDWHAAWRLSYQVNTLLSEQADICGLDRLWFYDADNERAWQYVYQGRPRWLAGGSFCYRKSVWERQPFADVCAGEDTRFVREAPFKKVFALARDDFYVARIHTRNTCRKQTAGSCWRSVPASAVRALIDAAAAHGPGTPAADIDASGPRVSCIMPTRDRPQFVPLSIELFQQQTYDNRELIVIDDGDMPVRDLLPADDRIRYLRLERRMSLGDKRNLACQAASGEFVMHWDDDDWYGPGRLAAQLTPLIHDQADVSALSMSFVLSLLDMRFWRCRPEHHARIHFRNLCPGTIAYRRRLWAAGARYAAINCAEDVAFLKALAPTVRTLRIPDEHHFVCVRHALNTWSIQLDWQRSPSGWDGIAAPGFIDAAHMARYREESQRLGGRTAADARREPGATQQVQRLA